MTVGMVQVSAPMVVVNKKTLESLGVEPGVVVDVSSPDRDTQVVRQLFLPNVRCQTRLNFVYIDPDTMRLLGIGLLDKVVLSISKEAVALS